MGPAIREGFIGKHWRGEYSLPFAYWVISIVTSVSLTVSNLYIIEYVENQTTFNPYILFFSNVIILAVFLIVTIWHFIGTWRSADRYTEKNRANGGASYWGHITKILMVLGLVRALASFITIGGAIITFFPIAFQNDPEMPDYKLTIIENGKELKIAGGLKYGIVHDVETILKSAPSVQTINFESVGGRIGVGFDLYNFIREKGLNTVTNTYCQSACTIAFAGGANRWVGFSGQLGFHAGKAVIQGRKGAMIDEDRKTNAAINLKNGTSLQFLQKGMRVSNSDMWYPEREELFKEMVITSFASKAESSITELEKDLNELAEEERKSIIKNSNKAIEHVDIDVKKNLFVYIYNVSVEMHRIFQTDEARIEQKSHLAKSVCEDEQLKKNVRLGVRYGFYYQHRFTKEKSYYAEINNCDP